MTDRNDLHPQEPREELTAEVMGLLSRPRTPAALDHPAFLEAIYERAAQDSLQVGSTDLGGFLQETLPPQESPVGLEEAWELDRAAENGAEHLPQTTLQGPGAPGWMWSRIRADVRRQIAERRKPNRFVRWAAAAAAVLLVSTSLVVILDPFQGTKPQLPFVPEVEEMDQPIGEPFHPAAILKRVAR